MHGLTTARSTWPPERSPVLPPPGAPEPRPSSVRLIERSPTSERVAPARAPVLRLVRRSGEAKATLSRTGAHPITLRPVNDTGSRGAPSGNDPAAVLSVVAPDTDTLVARVQHGDRWAFTELFRRHRTDVLRLVHRMMGASPEVEDIVQEVFLQVHRSIGEFRGQSKFSTWLHRVTVNVVLMHRRAARSRPAFTGEAPTDAEPDSGLAPDEDAMRRRQIEAFRRLLDRLPEKKRTVFELHELCGWSPAAIAEHVDAPVLTVRTRLFYARREIEALVHSEPVLAQLAEELKNDDSDGPPEGSAGSMPDKAGAKETP